ncbi:ZIP family metal transporter [Streptomyces luteolus]|uniref:ZIP family zinc transporter n=1 Tax=Streptomyces luteolus TaxID=3043615 RepID=A0ABT6T0I6_9ACTN|nr:ZIP family zinc transporter [Streptomyces sp. B-S-A12]MDI3420893.1 ZIP family zinc transporter [Streptomyces sp. B-S-A12]
MREALVAGLWGLLAGSALLAGAALGTYLTLPRRLIGLVMAFGSGVLIAAVAYELVAEAHDGGGMLAAALGTAVGALLYSAGNAVLARRGARHRKRTGGRQPSETEQPGSGGAIALGSVLDGIPESVVIGASTIGSGSVSAATVGAVFLSNLPEGMASSTGMRDAGRSRRYVFGLWSAIAVLCGVAALVGRALLGGAPPLALALVTAVAAGAILAMIADTMLPEAHEQSHLLTGMATVTGFLTAFALTEA